MSDTIGLNCNIFLRNIIKATGVCIFMFALSWRMSLLTFMGLPIVFAVSEVYGNYYKVNYFLAYLTITYALISFLYC